MPKPKHIDGRRVWDRLKVDNAFSALPGDDGDEFLFVVLALAGASARAGSTHKRGFAYCRSPVASGVI